MFKQRVKHFVATFFGLLGAAIFICGVVYVYTYLPVPKHTDDDPTVTILSILHDGDPAMLYQTVGIKECGRDALFKMEETRAVLLTSDDLAQVSPFLTWRFSEPVSAVLYVNTPEGAFGTHGKPALIALKEDNGKYCALGIAENWSPPLFLKLATKYQPLLNQ